MSKTVDAEPVYYHDCPALGKHVKVVRAVLASKDGSEVYGWQHKCPFCSYTAGEFTPNEEQS